MLKNDFFGFPEVHLTGEVDISVRFSCHISQNLTYQKLLKSVNFWQSYSKNKKVDVFGDTGYISLLINWLKAHSRVTFLPPIYHIPLLIYLRRMLSGNQDEIGLSLLKLFEYVTGFRFWDMVYNMCLLPGLTTVHLSDQLRCPIGLAGYMYLKSNLSCSVI